MDTATMSTEMDRQHAGDRVLEEADRRVGVARAEAERRILAARAEADAAAEASRSQRRRREETEFKLHDLIWVIEEFEKGLARTLNDPDEESSERRRLGERIGAKFSSVLTRKREIKRAIRKKK